MIIFKKADAVENYVKKLRSAGMSVGFIPTMGALHQGHLSLIDAAKKENDFVIASIFVNPTQFNNKADFEKYPVTISEDINKLEAGNCDLLFLPGETEIYPTIPDFTCDLGYLENILEGVHRPGHFQGVCQVVHRLLNIVNPHELYIGQKDYQQCMVIKKLVKDTKPQVHVQVIPTLREDDGLAMSSRNMRLNREERKLAPHIYQVLQWLNKNVVPGDLQKIKEEAASMLIKKNMNVDYIEIADSGNLKVINNWNGIQPYVILVAAYVNDIRLIDNVIGN